MTSVTHLTNQSQFIQSNAAFNGTNISGTIASNGISLSVAPGGGGADGYNILAAGTQTANTTGTIMFSNSNGITFGMSNSSIITASHNGLTTAMASNRGTDFVQATAAFNGTNASGTIASNAISVSVAPQTAFVFSNSNGVSFGTNGSTVTATVATNYQSSNANYLTSQSNQAFSASGGSSAFQTLNFANSNGITFSNSNGSVIASHNGLTTARASNDGIGTNTAQSNVTWTVNSSGISFDARGYAGTGTTFNGANLSGSMTVNSNGVQLSMSAAAPGGGAAVTVSASNGSFTVGNLNFSNANNVTFGTSAGSIITASVAAPGAAAENNAINLLGANTAGNTTATGSTIGWSGVNVTLSGTNGSQVVVSAPATSSIVGASGISLSTNGSTITIGRVLQSEYVPFIAMSTNSQTLGVLGATSASARFFPMDLSDNIAFNVLNVMHNLSYATSSVVGSQTITYNFGLYSNNANSLSLISSNSFSLAVTNSSVSNTVSYPVSTNTAGYTYTTLAQTTTANIQSFWGTAVGGRPIGLVFGNSMSLSSGDYWLGVLIRHSSSSANIGISMAINGNANAVHNNLAGLGQASTDQTTNYSIRYGQRALGAYTVTQSTLPNGVAMSQIAHTQTVMPLFSFLST